MKITHKFGFATLLIGSVVAASTASAALVSVTTDASTGGNATTTSTTRNDNAGDLVGPAGDTAGSTWNIISGFSSTNLLDSNGNATSIDWSTSYTERRGVGTGSLDLEIARIYMQDFSKANTSTLTISDLTIGGLYDVWLVSVSNSGVATENYRGDISTANATSSSNSQGINSSPRNITTFVAGQNFVKFSNVVADLSGEISFTMQGANIDGLPNNGDEYRLGLNGFQIEAVPEPSSLLLGGIGFLALLRRRRI